MKSICVFCGSSLGLDPLYKATTASLGQVMAQQGISLVYGGGKVGLMGVLADSVLAAGGKVSGVIPKFLELKELAHQGLSELHVVASMQERKALMADLAEGFMALPGGFGTLEEFCEVLTWAQLGLHQKPLGLLNVNGFYDSLLRLFEEMRTAGFVRSIFQNLVLEASEAGPLLEKMSKYQPVLLEKWVSATEELR